MCGWRDGEGRTCIITEGFVFVIFMVISINGNVCNELRRTVDGALDPVRETGFELSVVEEEAVELGKMSFSMLVVDPDCLKRDQRRLAGGGRASRDCALCRFLRIVLGGLLA